MKYVRKMFRKTNISNSLILIRTGAYQGARNVSFSENFAYVLNGCPQIHFDNPSRKISVKLITNQSQKQSYYDNVKNRFDVEQFQRH